MEYATRLRYTKMLAAFTLDTVEENLTPATLERLNPSTQDSIRAILRKLNIAVQGASTSAIVNRLLVLDTELAYATAEVDCVRVSEAHYYAERGYLVATDDDELAEMYADL